MVIETSHAGRLRAVSSVRQAAEVLVGDWPAEKRGSLWRGACATCHAAWHGRRCRIGASGVHPRR